MILCNHEQRCYGHFGNHVKAAVFVLVHENHNDSF